MCFPPSLRPFFTIRCIVGISPIVGKDREEENDESLTAENQRPTDGIVILRKFEHRTGISSFRNSLKLQDSVNVLYTGMKQSLAQFDNRAYLKTGAFQNFVPVSY